MKRSCLVFVFFSAVESWAMSGVLSPVGYGSLPIARQKRDQLAAASRPISEERFALHACNNQFNLGSWLLIG